MWHAQMDTRIKAQLLSVFPSEVMTPNAHAWLLPLASVEHLGWKSAHYFTHFCYTEQGKNVLLDNRGNAKIKSNIVKMLNQSLFLYTLPLKYCMLIETEIPIKSCFHIISQLGVLRVC